MSRMVYNNDLAKISSTLYVYHIYFFVVRGPASSTCLADGQPYSVHCLLSHPSDEKNLAEFHCQNFHPKINQNIVNINS